jgi:transposase
MHRDALERWLQEGLSLEAIGRRTGRHPSTVGYWARKYGLTPVHRARHAARGGIPRTTLEVLVGRGFTTRQIAAELGCSQATVRHWLQEYGLQTAAAARRRDKGSAAPGGRFLAECRRHGITEFVVRRDGSSRCCRCRSEAVADRRRRIKSILVEEAGGSCALCGYRRCIAALQFHHREPAMKRFSVAARGVTRSLDAARAEAEKCVLLCANCHAEVEAGARVLPR